MLSYGEIMTSLCCATNETRSVKAQGYELQSIQLARHRTPAVPFSLALRRPSIVALTVR